MLQYAWEDDFSSISPCLLWTLLVVTPSRVFGPVILSSPLFFSNENRHGAPTEKTKTGAAVSAIAEIYERIGFAGFGNATQSGMRYTWTSGGCTFGQ